MSTTHRSTVWSVTINNPTKSDDENINLARQKGWKVYGQEECGESGTPHYQLMVKTPQVRFSAVKKQFGRAHVEVARDPVALAKYIEKEDTRVGDLPAQESKYPSLSKYWDLVFEYLNDLGKDGFDEDSLIDDEIKMYRPDRQKIWLIKPLTMLDEATTELITQGYHVEGIAGNPSIRSQWNLYHNAIMLRCLSAKRDSAIEAQQHAEVPIYEGEEVREEGQDDTSPAQADSHHEDSPEDNPR